jgi:hypothetical protein
MKAYIRFRIEQAKNRPPAHWRTDRLVPRPIRRRRYDLKLRCFCGAMTLAQAIQKNHDCEDQEGI